MPIGRCIAETTHREYLTWMAWLDSQWNKPSRLDYYIMQLTYRVATLFAKKETSLKISSFKLPFKKVKVQPEVMRKTLTDDDRKFQIASDKSRWFGFLGLKQRVDDGE